MANHVSDVQVRNGGKTLVRHSVQKGDTLLGRLERPVATALVVMPSIAVSVPPVDPLAGVALGLKEQALGLPAPAVANGAVKSSGGAAQLAADDPASAPDGRLPVLVGPRPAVGTPLVRVAVLFDVLALVALGCAALTVRHRRGGFRLR